MTLFISYAVLLALGILVAFIVLQRKNPDEADNVLNETRGFLSRLWAKIRGRE